MLGMMGQYTHNLDQKNRLAMPAKLREALGDNFVLCVAPNGDNCLFAYSPEGWEKIMEHLTNQTPSKLLTMQQRRVYMYADTVETDKQGRITIPSEFVQKAKLEREVLIRGIGTRVELWSPEEWDKMQARIAEMDELSQVNFPF